MCVRSSYILRSWPLWYPFLLHPAGSRDWPQAWRTYWCSLNHLDSFEPDVLAIRVQASLKLLGDVLHQQKLRQDSGRRREDSQHPMKTWGATDGDNSQRMMLDKSYTSKHNEESGHFNRRCWLRHWLRTTKILEENRGRWHQDRGMEKTNKNLLLLT